MNNIFGDFPETLETESTIPSGVTDQSSILKKSDWDEKAAAKADMVLEMLVRQMKKLKKKQKKLKKKQKKCIQSMKKNEKKRESKRKRFLDRLEDVFLKTFPALLTTIVSVAVKSIFGQSFRSKWSQRRVLA